MNKCQSWHLRLDKLSYEPGETKIEALKKAQADYNKQAVPHNSDGLGRTVARAQGFLQTLHQQHGECFLSVPLVNSTRMLLHLGRASVLENVGIYCERSSGLPLIPGTAVKGLLSTWACWEGNETALYPQNATGELMLEQRRSHFNANARRIFGDNSDSGSTDAGEIVFVGAFPVRPPVLGLDIVTPHTNSAGVDQNPVPSPFLAIEPGTTWNFAFIAKGRNGHDSQSLFDVVRPWLTDALEQCGLGAKTAAGYGRFLTSEKWNDATLTTEVKAQNEAAHKAQKEKDARLAEIRAGYTGDYTEITFGNTILKRLGKPGEYQLLQNEIKSLQGNPDNAPWIHKITDALRTNKDARKSLKDKDWFPKEWLPQ